MFSVKDPVPVELRSNAVYKFTCASCNSCYVSETSRHLSTRIREHLRWLKTVSSTYIWMGRYNHSLSLDPTINVSKNCSIIGKHVVIIFLTQ